MAENKIFAAVIDLETTGLDARENIPLELGIQLIDRWGEKIGKAESWLIWEANHDWSLEMGKGAADQFVGPMHQESGLWNDLGIGAGKTTRTRAGLDLELCLWLKEHGILNGTVPMMGNSIGSLDRPFVLEHFPRFNKALSYRNIDMSSIKEICKAVNPELAEKLKPIIGTKEDADHRVLGDIEACITEYRAYLDNFLFCEED